MSLLSPVPTSAIICLAWWRVCHDSKYAVKGGAHETGGTGVCLLAVLALLSTACNAFSSADAPAAPALLPTIPSAGQAPALQPTSAPVQPAACRSRLWGKVTNVATGEAPPNVAVEVSVGARTFKTVTDANGLYGFAGLCAGQYAMTIAPPGAKPIVDPNRVALDGSNPVRVDLPYRKAGW